MTDEQDIYNAELEAEEENAEQLAAEQELYAAETEAIDLSNQGQEFQRPSLIKYLVILAPLAGIVDLIDFIDLSGVGAFIGRVVSLGASVLIILIFWLTNTKQKRADDYVESIQEKIDVITKRIANAEKQIVRVARLSRKVPGTKRIYRRVHLATIRKARVA